jgi:hypothetical protein
MNPLSKEERDAFLHAYYTHDDYGVEGRSKKYPILCRSCRDELIKAIWTGKVEVPRPYQFNSERDLAALLDCLNIVSREAIPRHDPKERVYDSHDETTIEYGWRHLGNYTRDDASSLLWRWLRGMDIITHLTLDGLGYPAYSFRISKLCEVSGEYHFVEAYVAGHFGEYYSHGHIVEVRVYRRERGRYLIVSQREPTIVSKTA